MNKKSYDSKFKILLLKKGKKKNEKTSTLLDQTLNYLRWFRKNWKSELMCLVSTDKKSAWDFTNKKCPQEKDLYIYINDSDNNKWCD